MKFIDLYKKASNGAQMSKAPPISCVGVKEKDFHKILTRQNLYVNGGTSQYTEGETSVNFGSMWGRRDAERTTAPFTYRSPDLTFLSRSRRKNPFNDMDHHPYFLLPKHSFGFFLFIADPDWGRSAQKLAEGRPPWHY